MEALLERFAGGIRPSGRSPTVRPDRMELPDGEVLSVYYKHYEYARPTWRFVGRPSKARREFLNYQVFRRLGLRVPETVACGEQREWGGRLRLAFIITRTIPDAWMLPDFWEHLARDADPAVASAQRWVLLRQLAEGTRQLHEASFFHNDLVWRNLLVTWAPPADAVLWWIDCPSGAFSRFGPIQRRRRIKDLAMIDKLAQRLCSPRERVAALRHYLRSSGPDPRVATLARSIRADLERRGRAD